MTRAEHEVRREIGRGFGRGDGRTAFAAGAILLALVAAGALVSLVWTPYSTAVLDIAARLQPPSATHVLGTDAYGRDVASELIAGGRTALAVALASCALGLGLGAPLGLLAAARRGWAETMIGRGADLAFAFPAILTAVLIAASLGPGMWDAVAAIGVSSAPVFTRVARTGALRLWSLDFALAARAAGKGRARITLEHILPNLMPTLVVQATLQLGLAVVAEAGLAYIGLSAQPPQPSWGRMLADAQTLIGVAPWLAVFPGLAIVVTVAGFGLVGEGLRLRGAPR